MTSTTKMTPFVPPHETMVVLTVRVPPSTRKALRAFFRRDAEERFTSVSNIVQTAIDEFLERNKA